MWELLNDGAAPYADIPFYQIPVMVTSGQRPPILHPSSKLNDLMVQCWDQDPNRRPIMQQVLDQLNQL